MISVETKEHLVRMVREDDRSVAAAARDLRISVRSATRFLRYFLETGGDFHCDPAQWNRHFDNSADDLQLRDAVLSTACREPELFLDEKADAVNDSAAQIDGAVEVSPATVAQELGRNGYTRRVVERAFITRNKAKRVSWVADQWRIPLRCRVYVDEAHRAGRAAERRWAWLLRGARSECEVTSSPGVRTSVFVAMAHDELLEWMITRPPPGQTSVDILFFMTNFVLPRLSTDEEGGEWAHRPERCVLVLGNARVPDEVALATVRDAGVVLLLLPPHSPDLNPFEDVFSVGSSWLWRYSHPEQFNA